MQICSFYYCFGQKNGSEVIYISWEEEEGVYPVGACVHYSSFSPLNQKYLLPLLGGEERKKESRGGKKGDGNE